MSHKNEIQMEGDSEGPNSSLIEDLSRQAHFLDFSAVFAQLLNSRTVL